MRKLLGPFPVTGGPAAGQSINYFQAPFGTYVESISYPDGMAYEATAKRKLWSAHDIGAKATDRGIPGLLGLDHVGITVPDVKQARRWLEKNLGGESPLRFGPISDPTGTLMARPRRRRSARRDRGDQRGARRNGSNIELFQYSAPDQDTRFAANSSYSGHHIAIYVDCIGPRHNLGHPAAARASCSPRRPLTDGPGRRPVDQLLRHAVRDVRRADLLSQRHGLRSDRRSAELCSPKDVPLKRRHRS